MVINVFSKYGWAEPLKTKSTSAVTSAFKKIFEENHAKGLWIMGRTMEDLLQGQDILIFHPK